MKRTLNSLAVALSCLLPAAGGRAQTQTAMPAAPSWKLLFSNSQDITDTWGSLHFGVSPVRVIREC